MALTPPGSPIVKGKMPRAEGTIDLPLSEHEQTSRSKAARGVNMQEAVTHYRVVSSMKEASLLAVRKCAMRNSMGSSVPSLQSATPRRVFPNNDASPL